MSLSYVTSYLVIQRQCTNAYLKFSNTLSSNVVIVTISILLCHFANKQFHLYAVISLRFLTICDFLYQGVSSWLLVELEENGRCVQGEWWRAELRLK